MGSAGQEMPHPADAGRRDGSQVAPTAQAATPTEDAIPPAMCSPTVRDWFAAAEAERAPRHAPAIDAIRRPLPERPANG